MNSNTMVSKLIAKRNIKAGSHSFKPGDEFIPTGGKWDKQIAEHLCNQELVPFGALLNEQLGRLSLNDLRQRASAAGLDAQGKKSDLVERIKSATLALIE